jgi:hypothetical protein
MLPSGSLQYDLYWVPPGKCFLSPSVFAAAHYCQVAIEEYWVFPAQSGVRLAVSPTWVRQDLVAGAAVGFRIRKNLLLRAAIGLPLWQAHSISQQGSTTHFFSISRGQLFPFSYSYSWQRLQLKMTLTWIIRDVFPVVRW